MRPIDAAGSRFQTNSPLAIVAWLQSEGFTLAIDQPGLVELTRGGERIRISAAGVVTPGGDSAHQTAHFLLMHCEE